MEIEYKESELIRLINRNKWDKISTVLCNQEEFNNLFEEAEVRGLLHKSSEKWFTLISVDFSVHLSNSK